ncbi:hypothetical protein V2G26_004968 [Clonostachys chloroleuca]
MIWGSPFRVGSGGSQRPQKHQTSNKSHHQIPDEGYETNIKRTNQINKASYDRQVKTNQIKAIQLDHVSYAARAFPSCSSPFASFICGQGQARIMVHMFVGPRRGAFPVIDSVASWVLSMRAYDDVLIIIANPPSPTTWSACLRFVHHIVGFLVLQMTLPTLIDLTASGFLGLC